jgi:sterol-4alpha-carboxylate 3-dehydrogenase (decarboxylating)
MAPIPPKTKPSLGKVLVVGGCGFLGSHIVSLLVTSYTAQVFVLDLTTSRNRRPDSDNVAYFNGDITSISSLIPIFEKIMPDVVIHTASPTLVGGSKAMYQKVNVEGTKCVIEACQKTGVKALVYTSSASVISDNESDLVNADERWPVIPPKAQTEYYSQTKACPHPSPCPKYPLTPPRLKPKPSSSPQTAPQQLQSSSPSPSVPVESLVLAMSN